MNSRFLILRGIFCGITAAAFLFVTTGHGATSVENDLMQADRAFDAATAQKGLPGFMSFLSDDMTTIRPNEPVVHGKEAFGEGWKGLLATPGLTLRWSPELASASRSGDLGYTVGSYEITRKDDAGTAHLTGSGKYITIWRKQPDGTWKVAFDSGVQDVLPPSAAAPTR